MDGYVYSYPLQGYVHAARAPKHDRGRTGSRPGPAVDSVVLTMV
jgi:hypothetical protein